MQNKLLILSGYMASGKDSVLNELVKNKGFNKLISHTTRPMRPKETNGVEYFFIDKDKFFEMEGKEEFVETREYFTFIEKEGKKLRDIWYYSLSKKGVNNRDKPTVVILDKQGGEDVIEYVGHENCVWIYLECDESVLRNRLNGRGDLEEEVNRRLRDDKKSFKGIENCVHSVINTEMELERVVESVVDTYNYWNRL